MISRRREPTAALKRWQRGFLINPYQFGGAQVTLTANLTNAYGVTPIIPGYGAGNLFRVSRGSDDTEQDCASLAAAVTFCGSANGYANWNSVGHYLNVTGASGSTSFFCAKRRRCTTILGAQVSTTLGFPTAIFDGSGDRIDVNLGTYFNIGSGNFRVRFKARFTTVTNCEVVGRYNGTASGSSFMVQLNTSGQIQGYLWSGSTAVASIVSAASTIAAGVTYDIEFGRSGSSVQLSVDGASVGTATTSATINAGPNTLEIGGGSADGATWTVNGHIWGLSFEPGVAGHTGSFTPDALYGIGGDGYVTTVYNQDGTANHLIQSTRYRQPMIVRNAVALAGWTFEGIDDYMETTSNTGTPTAFTVFAKAKQSVAPSGSQNFMLAEHSTDYSLNKSFYLLHGASGGSVGIGVAISDGVGNRLIGLNNTTADTTVMGVNCGKYDKTATGVAKRRMFRDGTERVDITVSSVGTVGTSAFDALKLYAGAGGGGTTNFSVAEMASLFVYDTAKSDADIATIGNLL